MVDYSSALSGVADCFKGRKMLRKETIDYARLVSVAV